MYTHTYMYVCMIGEAFSAKLCAKFGASSLQLLIFRVEDETKITLCGSLISLFNKGRDKDGALTFSGIEQFMCWKDWVFVTNFDDLLFQKDKEIILLICCVSTTIWVQAVVRMMMERWELRVVKVLGFEKFQVLFGL